MIWQARTFGRAADGARREAGEQRIDRILVGRDAADDVRYDVHDVAVEFDGVAVGHRDAATGTQRGRRRCGRGRAASDVRRVPWDRRAGFSRFSASSALVRPRGRCVRSARIVILAVAHPNEDLGRRADQREAGQVEEIEEGRRELRTGGARDRDRRASRRCRTARCRRRHLKNVARGDIIRCAVAHHRREILRVSSRGSARCRRAAPWSRRGRRGR